MTLREIVAAHSPPYKGGVARSAGVVAHNETWLVSDHPVRSFQRWLRGIFFTSRPPLLRKEGNASPVR